MDTKMLEFWGNAFLNAARNQQKIEDLNKMFGQNKSADDSMTNALYKNFSWPNAEKINPEEIVKFAEKAAGVYNNFFKSFLSIFDYISKEEYLRLVKENEGLKEKIAHQEKIINNFKNQSGKDDFDQKETAYDFTQLLEKQTQQFKELIAQVNLYYKKTPTTKKNKK